MISPKIFFVGMPGSGKSTLGKQLAELLHVKFFDLDKQIEFSAGKTISDIFKTSGEDYFRVIETQTLNQLIANESQFICSTGGGTACFHDNITTMNKRGETIFLDVPVETLIQRLQADRAQRPLLDGESASVLRERVTRFSEQRRKYYAQARHIFSGSNITVEQIRKELDC